LWKRGHHIAQTKIEQAQNQQCNLKDFFFMGILTLKYSINLCEWLQSVMVVPLKVATGVWSRVFTRKTIKLYILHSTTHVLQQQKQLFAV
jgi:hypothetical protein